MTIVLSTPPYQQFFDANGNPLNAGEVYTYAAGTTTPQATYTDQGGGTPSTNPIILDSAGRAVWWLDSTLTYKYVVKDSLGNTIRTVDNITPASSGGGLSSLGSVAAYSIIGNPTGSSAVPIAMTGAQAAQTIGGWTLIQTQTASASATIDFTGLSSTYSKYVVEIYGVIPDTDGAALWLRTSTDNGANYDSGVADYSWGYVSLTAGSPVTQNTDSSDDSIELSADQGTDANESGAFTVELTNPTGTNFTKIRYRGEWQNSGGALIVNSGGSGMRLSAADVTAVRFMYNTGNIEAGTFKLYGIAA